MLHNSQPDNSDLSPCSNQYISATNITSIVRLRWFIYVGVLYITSRYLFKLLIGKPTLL